MGGMFSPKPTPLPPTPEPKPPAPMPDLNSPQVRERRRSQQADIMGRAGRQSTILTAPSDRAGDTYASPKLG
jgi:hypothetical protein